MNYLILSDIHSNLEAFETVLRHAEGIGFDKVVVLGDLVGYGANPNEIVERIKSMPDAVVIRGNHDKVVSGKDSGEEFNELAIHSCRWTQEHLTKENLKYLEDLPAGPLFVDERFYISHGTPLDEDAYILTEFDAAAIFTYFPAKICFFGHSHIPFVFALRAGGEIGCHYPSNNESEYTLQDDVRYLINVGSIGQPRDRNPKSAYGIFNVESRSVRLFRLDYPIEEASRKILEAELPYFLAERLLWGA
jgi:predicted phosphodiesterase